METQKETKAMEAREEQTAGTEDTTAEEKENADMEETVSDTDRQYTRLLAGLLIAGIATVLWIIVFVFDRHLPSSAEDGIIAVAISLGLSSYVVSGRIWFMLKAAGRFLRNAFIFSGFLIIGYFVGSFTFVFMLIAFMCFPAIYAVINLINYIGTDNDIADSE